MKHLKHTIVLQHSVHQAKLKGLYAAHKLEVEHLRSAHLVELELKDSFCEAKKIHASYEYEESPRITPEQTPTIEAVELDTTVKEVSATTKEA